MHLIFPQRQLPDTPALLLLCAAPPAAPVLLPGSQALPPWAQPSTQPPRTSPFCCARAAAAVAAAAAAAAAAAKRPATAILGSTIHPNTPHLTLLLRARFCWCCFCCCPQAANVAIMAPSWSSWKLPKLSQEEERLEIARAKAALKDAGRSEDRPPVAPTARSPSAEAPPALPGGSDSGSDSSSGQGGEKAPGPDTPPLPPPGTPPSSGSAGRVVREVPLGSFRPPLDGKLPTKLDEAQLRVVPASSWGAGGVWAGGWGRQGSVSAL